MKPLRNGLGRFADVPPMRRGVQRQLEMKLFSGSWALTGGLAGNLPGSREK